jgi:hypothetical protein
VHQWGDWTGFHQLELISSHDLRHWQHSYLREPFLDNLPTRSGAYDVQTIMPSSPIVRDNELWFYYTGLRRYAIVSSELPDIGAICLAKLRLDGFVSLTGGDTLGHATTKPLILGGNNLHLNVDALRGEVRVEVLDSASQQILPGYSFQDCVPLAEDRLDAEVKWKKAALSSLTGKTVRFRFALRNASLYAFWVTQIHV